MCLSCLGTFSKCSQCSRLKNCCNSFDIIDDPLATKQELVQIERTFQLLIYNKQLNDSFFSLNDGSGTCCFYNNNKCTIYDARPLDCRLFPFDIKRIRKEFCLVVYTNPCDNFQLSEQFIEENISQIEAIVSELMPYISDYIAKDVCKKSSSKPYQIIKKIGVLR